MCQDMEDNRGCMSNILVIILIAMAGFNIYCTYMVGNQLNEISYAVSELKEVARDAAEAIESPSASEGGIEADDVKDTEEVSIQGDSPEEASSQIKDVPESRSAGNSPALPDLSKIFGSRQSASAPASASASDVEAAAPAAQDRMQVKAKERIEDRYAMGGVVLPDVECDSEGVVVVDITVDRLGIVTGAEEGSGTTISDEEVLYRCREAALKTRFSYNPDAGPQTSGTIKYIFTRK